MHTNTPSSPRPPRRSFPVVSPSLAPHCPPFSPIPSRKAQRGHLWRSWTVCSIPGPTLRHPPEGRLWREGQVWVLGIRGLPLGAAEHTAAREGGHREIGKRGPERIRHDPAAATWWQVRQSRRRWERARWADVGAAAGREGRAREGTAMRYRLPGGGAAGYQHTRPRPHAGLAPQPGLAYLSPRLTCYFSGAGANPSRRQRNKRIEVGMSQQLLPASFSAPWRSRNWVGLILMSPAYLVMG